ncbi:unnamed protein product [Urochloa decumbens]|uniref:Peptidase A1 domain-containing protein n=1 Tax=Urochloa decumbens TaxID=240449 RepID=A0ABC8YSU7_9POAL
MFSQFSPTLTMSIATLTLTALLSVAAGNSAVPEQVAAPPFGEPSFKGGFSLPIIHRNSLASPLRDPTATAFDLYKEEIQLASSHVQADALASEKMIVPSHFRRGLYLVPLRISGSLDRISSSGRCEFFRAYEDGSVAKGYYLVSDIFHFSLEGNADYHFEPEVVFGCATSEKSQFVREYNTGILSLDTSSLSFLAQVRVDKFSYCVPAPARRDDDDQALSYLRFGSQARISGKRIPFWNDKNKYHVLLKRVTYQHGNRLSQQQPAPIFPEDKEAEGSSVDMLVDSGTLGIWLPESIFYPLQKKIDTDISLSRVLFDDNPNAYCYRGTMKDVEEMSVTLGFVGGAEMELFGDSLFFEFNNSEWICLGFILSNVTTLGIYAQRNTNMGFDLFEKKISIDQTGCSF